MSEETLDLVLIKSPLKEEGALPKTEVCLQTSDDPSIRRISGLASGRTSRIENLGIVT